MYKAPPLNFFNLNNNMNNMNNMPYPGNPLGNLIENNKPNNQKKFNSPPSPQIDCKSKIFFFLFLFFAGDLSQKPPIFFQTNIYNHQYNITSNMSNLLQNSNLLANIQGGSPFTDFPMENTSNSEFFSQPNKNYNQNFNKQDQRFGNPAGYQNKQGSKFDNNNRSTKYKKHNNFSDNKSRTFEEKSVFFLILLRK